MTMSIHAGDKMKKRILLTGVFGPFGVDDAFGRKENIMELFHNQVTKVQGDASLRFHHRSFGLYFIAANIDADVTVLDFPTRKRFIKEIKKGYDVVGISFIAPNFIKAKDMARLSRSYGKGATIILGGHGAAIEGIETLIPCDHVVKGEGIRWMRRYLGQKEDAPFIHPALPTSEHQSIFGVPVPAPAASVLVPGVGCVNGCSFCSTSHFFGKTYTPFLSSGAELFETARRIADERGTDAFMVMDENFLKDRNRAMELVEEMERHRRFFSFQIFSSAEAVTAFGLDNLVRLGVQFIWIGFESKSQKNLFEKNKHVDPVALVRELRLRGISVLASGILCMEHHTPKNIHTDVDFLVGLNADLVQFMLLTPLPTTGLYMDHKRRGLLRDDVPREDIHGQKRLNYKHPAFSNNEPEQLLIAAFRKDFEVNGSSIFRIIDTNVRGLKHLIAADSQDACLRARKAQVEARVKEYSRLLPVIQLYAVNELEQGRAKALERDIRHLIGPLPLKEKVARTAAKLLARRWALRTSIFGDMIQPKTIVTRFDGLKTNMERLPMHAANPSMCESSDMKVHSAAAFSASNV
jgi:radical SAM superfamily enzyme YgiQ (UPF0313 family)